MKKGYYQPMIDNTGNPPTEGSGVNESKIMTEFFPVALLTISHFIAKMNAGSIEMSTGIKIDGVEYDASMTVTVTPKS